MRDGKASKQESIATRSGSVDEGNEYSEEEMRFLQVVDEFKRRARVRFPTAVDLFRLAQRHLKREAVRAISDKTADVRIG